MNPIWIVDDDQSIRFVLEKALLREELPTRSFTNPRDVLRALSEASLEEYPQVLLSDIRMPGGSGLELLSEIKLKYPSISVIIMTAFSDLDSAVSSFQGGAFEYLPKPFDVPKAVDLVKRALEEVSAKSVGVTSSQETPEMLGQAPAMQDVFRVIGRLSQSNVTVLITGESGSGKELVARALHKHSQRSNGTFVAINTAAIPKDLLESELFGHERGAFTGAQTMRRGRFEQAEGGTLFLDEIGDMPFDLQTRLLRVLSDGNFYRVGGHTSIKANVRVIAATHQDLEQRVKEGAFREDLFHRLNVIRLRLPALRERKEDIPVLTHFFLKQSAVQLGVDPKRISAAALSVLIGFPFPGNVRQLENICHWLSVMTPSLVVEPKDLPPEVLEFYHQHQAQMHTSSLEPASITPHNEDLTLSAHLKMQKSSEFMTDGHSIGAHVRPLQVDRRLDSEAIGSNKSSSNLHRDMAHVGLYEPNEYAGFEGGQVKVTWEHSLELEAAALLSSGQSDVWGILSKKFEAKLIQTALSSTKGRRIEAAVKLGIGRNTITRKIQELGLED